MEFSEKQRQRGDNGTPVQVLPTPILTPARNWRWKKRAGTRFDELIRLSAQTALAVFHESLCREDVRQCDYFFLDKFDLYTRIKNV